MLQNLGIGVSLVDLDALAGHLTRGQPLCFSELKQQFGQELLAPTVMTMGHSFAVAVVALMFGTQCLAQTPVAPVKVGTQGVVQPRIVREVAPVYPRIAESVRISGIVIVEATIGANGRVTDSRIARSIPLLDPAALEAVRQWEFAPPDLVGGVSVPVVTTVKVQFILGGPPGRNGPSRVSALSRPAWLPPDFDLAYTYVCSSGTVTIDTNEYTLSGSDSSLIAKVPLHLGMDEFESIYQALVRADFFTSQFRVSTWPAVKPETRVEDDGVYVGVLGDVPILNLGLGHHLDVRQSNAWRRMSWGEPARDPGKEIQERSRAGRLIREIVASKDAVRELPRNQRSCL